MKSFITLTPLLLYSFCLLLEKVILLECGVLYVLLVLVKMVLKFVIFTLQRFLNK